MSKHLNDHQLAAIAWASDAETTRELADRLGVTYAAVRFSRKRLRAEGFVCRIYWTTCTKCGEMLAGRRHTQEFHEQCGADHKREYTVRDDVRSARAAYVAANADRAREYQERRAARAAWIQMRTQATAHRHRQPWTPEEDARVLNANRHETLEAVAIAIGRRYKSVLSRRAALRRRQMIAITR